MSAEAEENVQADPGEGITDEQRTALNAAAQRMNAHVQAAQVQWLTAEVQRLTLENLALRERESQSSTSE